jgi:hypothetical protein
MAIIMAAALAAAQITGFRIAGILLARPFYPMK